MIRQKAELYVGEDFLSHDDGKERTDTEVVARVLGGDREAFGILMRRHGKRLLRVAIAVLRDENEAEEVVQETFVRAFTHLSQFEGRAQFSTWLLRIGFHEALARKRLRQRFLELGDDDSRYEPLFHRAISPERCLWNAEISFHLRRGVAKLPGKHRDAVVLVYLRDFDRAATAAALHISEANLKVRLHRARRLLRSQMWPLQSHLP